jgi:CheY-like chemotaxis protein
MKYQNILIIDEDEDDREIFLEAVKEVSSTVECMAFDSGIEALKQLRLHNISPDVIFLDLNMPVMSDQQFLMELKNDPDLQSIPVITFSTSSRPSTIQEMKELGATDFITKPSGFRDLVHILMPVLKKNVDGRRETFKSNRQSVL